MIKEVGFNYECPFHYSETYMISDVTAGSDSKCAFLDNSCCGLGKKECPLKNDSVLVQKKVK